MEFASFSRCRQQHVRTAPLGGPRIALTGLGARSPRRAVAAGARRLDPHPRRAVGGAWPDDSRLGMIESVLVLVAVSDDEDVSMERSAACRRATARTNSHRPLPCPRDVDAFCVTFPSHGRHEVGPSHVDASATKGLAGSAVQQGGPTSRIRHEHPNRRADPRRLRRPEISMPRMRSRDGLQPVSSRFRISNGYSARLSRVAAARAKDVAPRSSTRFAPSVIATDREARRARARKQAGAPARPRAGCEALTVRSIRRVAPGVPDRGPRVESSALRDPCEHSIDCHSVNDPNARHLG